MMGCIAYITYASNIGLYCLSSIGGERESFSLTHRFPGWCRLYDRWGSHAQTTRRPRLWPWSGRPRRAGRARERRVNSRPPALSPDGWSSRRRARRGDGGAEAAQRSAYAPPSHCQRVYRLPGERNWCSHWSTAQPVIRLRTRSASVSSYCSTFVF